MSSQANRDVCVVLRISASPLQSRVTVKTFRGTRDKLPATRQQLRTNVTDLKICDSRLWQSDSILRASDSKHNGVDGQRRCRAPAFISRIKAGSADQCPEWRYPRDMLASDDGRTPTPGGCSRFRFWFDGFRQRRCRRNCETSRTLIHLNSCATSDFDDPMFTGVRFVPCKRSLQTRSDDGTVDGGRDVARSGGAG